MKKLSWLFVLFFKIAFALPAVNLAHFTNSAWSNNSVDIPGMSQVLSIKSAEIYSWAIGYQQANSSLVSFYDGQAWHPAESINGMTSPMQIVPLYDDGSHDQAFALGLGKAAYFDGASWSAAQSVNGFQSLSLLTSDGLAYAVNTSAPISVSFFDATQKTWLPPHDLSAYISRILAMAEAQGKFYLLGFNSQGDLILFSGDQQQVWNIYNFGQIQPRPYNAQLLASDTSVFVGLMSDAGSNFYYSKDQGQSWNSTPWSGGLLLSPIENGILWGINDPNVGYFDSNAVNPAWQLVDVPPAMQVFQLYTGPSLDGQGLCVENDDGPQVACYSVLTQQWQNIPTSMQLSRIDQIFLVNNNQLLASGADAHDHPALFYYNGQAWQGSYVPGLTKSILNVYFGYPLANVWALGHD